MKFGWLTRARFPSPDHDAKAISAQLEQATLAEELEFAGVWLTEHNCTGESVYATNSVCCRSRHARGPQSHWL